MKKMHLILPLLAANLCQENLFAAATSTEEAKAPAKEITVEAILAPRVLERLLEFVDKNTPTSSRITGAAAYGSLTADDDLRPLAFLSNDIAKIIELLTRTTPETRRKIASLFITYTHRKPFRDALRSLGFNFSKENLNAAVNQAKLFPEDIPGLVADGADREMVAKLIKNGVNLATKSGRDAYRSVGLPITNQELADALYRARIHHPEEVPALTAEIAKVATK